MFFRKLGVSNSLVGLKVLAVVQASIRGREFVGSRPAVKNMFLEFFKSIVVHIFLIFHQKINIFIHKNVQNQC